MATTTATYATTFTVDDLILEPFEVDLSSFETPETRFSPLRDECENVACDYFSELEYMPPSHSRKPRSSRKIIRTHFLEISNADSFIDDDDYITPYKRDCQLAHDLDYKLPASNESLTLIREALVRTLPTSFRAQMKDLEYCCKHHCLTVVPARHSCTPCHGLPMCMCECLVVQNRRARNQRRLLAAQKNAFLDTRKKETQLRRQLDRIKQQRKQVSNLYAQMFEEVVQIPGNVNGTLGSIQTLATKITEFIESVGKSFGLPEGFDVVSIALALYSGLSALCKRNWLAAVSALALVARLAKIDWTNWYNLIVEALSGKPQTGELAAQMFEELLSNNSLISVFGTVLVSGVSLLMGASRTDYPGIIKHLGDFGRAAVGWTKAMDLFTWLVRFAKDAYYRYTLGKSLEAVELESNFPQLAKAMTQCEVLRGADFKMEYLDRDAKLCNIVTKLEDELLSLKYDALRARQNDLVAILTTELQKLSTTFLAARNSAAFSNAVRAAPTTLWMYGRAGVGKSNLMNYLKHEIYKRKYVDDKEWILSNVSHTRCADNEFWDGIIPGQPIVVYDDILQKKDTTANPNPEIMEIIRIKNESAYHLHMSNVSDKKNYYFTSPYVVATSNVKIPNLVSIADPSAFTRRWDTAIEVKVNPAYGKTSADGTYQIIDANKVEAERITTGEAFCKGVYVIDIYNLADGTIVQQDMTLDAFVTHFFDNSEKVLAASADLSASMQRQCGLQEVRTTTTYSEFYSKLTGQSGENFEDTEEEVRVEDDEVRGLLTRLYDNRNITEDVTEPATSFGALLARPKEKLVEAGTWITDRYNKVHESQKVKDVIAWIKLQATEAIPRLKTFGTWLYNLITSTTFHSYVRLATAGLMGYYVFGDLFQAFSSRKCQPYQATTLKEVRSATLCAKGCGFCDSVPHTAEVGTATYAHYLLSRLVLHYCEHHYVRRWNAMMFANLPDFTREVTVTTVVDAKTLLEMTGESKEIVTRSPAQRISAESKEIVTRVAPRGFAAESMTMTTRRQLAGQTLTGETVNTLTAPAGHNLAAQMKDLVQLEQWESIVCKNAVTLQCGASSVAGVFLTGRTLLTCYHFVLAVHQRLGKMTIMPVNQKTGRSVTLSHCAVTRCTDANGTPVDLAIVTIPNEPSRPSILSKFCQANQLDYAIDSPFVVTGIREVAGHSAIYSFHGQKPRFSEGVSYSCSVGPQTIHKSIFYEVDTRAGDCGSIVMTKDPRCAGKIIGMHVAGNGHLGVACALSRQFVERNLNNHVDTCAVTPRMLVDARVPFSGEMKSPSIVDATPQSTMSKLGNCLTLGMLTAPFASTKTQLRPSLVSGLLQDPTTKPAILGKVTVDGAVIDPMTKGIAKVLNVTQPLDPVLLNICAADVASVHATPCSTKEVLDFKTAITGIEGSDYITPLNRKSSPGYPYSLDNKGPGKRDWFGYDEYEFSPEVEADVETLLKHARNNQRGDVVWVATLKDERRPIEKVDAGKTRVFAAGPMHYTIAVRMYFLRFVEHIMRNRIDNEIGVGTNVYSLDWHKTGESLGKYGKHVIAGDFSNFDGSLLQDALWSICDIINDWYNDGPENRQIREVLFEEICNARILVNGELIQCDHSQPSGNPLTVIVNSLFNQIIMRYAYLLCKKKAGKPIVCDFSDHVSLQTYGDDNVLNIDEYSLAFYNQLTITDALASVGMTYTDEGKTGQLVPSRTLGEIAYLKRSFVLDDCGFYRAPLDISVCREMTNWIRGKGNGKQATYENVEAALREFYYHGRSTYSEMSKLLVPALRELGITRRLPLYDELESVNKEQFLSTRPVNFA
nr:MAG: polyprotein 1 [Picornavirales sp.]